MYCLTHFIRDTPTGGSLPFHSGYACRHSPHTWWLHLVFVEPVCTRSNFYRFSHNAKGLHYRMDAICIFDSTCFDWVHSDVWVEYLRKFLTFKNGGRRRVSDGSDIEYIGNELGSNFGSSSVSVPSESNLDERHGVVLVKLWQCVCDRRTMLSIWVRNLFGDSNFLGFQGSWVEHDFSQLEPFKEFVKQTRAVNV